jgi:hypothetical protein
MLRFAVFDEEGPAPTWRLAHAHLLGSDDVAAAGTVAFRDGHIECHPEDPAAAHALVLLVDAGRAGALMLPTCLLQQRTEPYRLYEELARHRIKTFLEKSEAWGLLDPAKAPDAFKAFEGSRSEFVRGMLEQDPFRAEMRHRDALALGIAASERLTARRSDWMLHGRYGKQGASHALGVRVPLERHPEHLKTTLHREFDILSIPTPWAQIEPTPGRFVWDATDRWMAWAKQNGRRAIAGPLLDLGPTGLPGWARPRAADPAKLRDALFEFVRQTVVRYGPVCGLWNIASSVHMNESSRLGLTAMVEHTRVVAVAARGAKRDARLLVEIGDPFNATVTANAGAVSALQYLKAIISDGVTFDLLGVPLLIGETSRGRATRDIMQLASVLDRFTGRKEIPPVIVTALGAPSTDGGEGAGWWREHWTPRSQGAFATMAFKMALANPGVAAVVWDRLRDDAGAGALEGGLFARDGAPKPAAEQLLTLRKRLRSPLGTMDAANGSAAGGSIAGQGGSPGREEPVEGGGP